METLESRSAGFNSTVKAYWDLILGFLRSKFFLIALLITIALGYGFTLTNFSYGVDDTSFDTLFQGTGFLSTGRFSAYILNKIFSIYDFVPFWQDFLAIIMLFGAVVVWCALIKRIAGDKVGLGAYIAFAAVFISFPNINEIFIYMMAGFSIGLGFLLTGVSLMVCHEVFFNKLNWKWLILPALVMCFSVSLYESFAPVFLCGMVMMMILKILFSDTKKKSFKYYLVALLKFCGVLLIGIIIRYVVAQIILYFGKIEPSTYPAVLIQWGKGASLQATIKSILLQLYYVYYLYAYKYLYILLFSVSCGMLILTGTVLSIKKGDYKLILLFLAVIAASFMLTALQGKLTPFRANQSHMVIVAFVVFLLCAYAKKWRKPLILFMVSCLVLIQTKDLSQWFYNDYMRYQQDKTIVITIGNEVKKLDATKPVVFTGSTYNFYPNLKNNQTNGMSVIHWGMTALGSDSELLKFFHIHGFDLVQSNNEQKVMAKEIASSMPAWPREGSIKEYNGVIIVNFGQQNK